MKKRTKFLAFVVTAAMALCAMPLVGFAEEVVSPITINGVLIVKADDFSTSGLLDVTVNYTVPDDVGEQMTLLATVTNQDVQTDAVTGQPTNIAYIDQTEKPVKPADKDRNFTFKVVASSLGSSNELYVKVGGTDVTTAAKLTGVFDGGTTPIIIYGDVNGDGNVTAADAALVLQKIAGILTSFPDSNAAPDVNSDGNITAADAALVLQKIAGIISLFPAEVN